MATSLKKTAWANNNVEEDRLGEQQSPEALAAHVEANRLFRARQDAGASLS